MENCLFCKIIAGEIPCHKIYEDEDVLAFLDINPISDGHTLVIPKKHSKDIHEFETKGLGDKLLSTSRKIANALRDKLGHKGIMIMELNGEPQEVPHIHFHVFGRDSASPSKLVRPEGISSDQEHLKSIANKLT